MGSALFGIADAIYLSQAYALLADVVPAEQGVVGFAFFRLLGSLGNAVGFVLPLPFGKKLTHVALQAGLLALSVPLALSGSRSR